MKYQKWKRVSYEAEDLPLDIVYEDQDVVVVNKPQRHGCSQKCGSLEVETDQCAVMPCQGPFQNQWGIASGIVHQDR